MQHQKQFRNCFSNNAMLYNEEYFYLWIWQNNVKYWIHAIAKKNEENINWHANTSNVFQVKINTKKSKCEKLAHKIEHVCNCLSKCLLSGNIQRTYTTQ